VGKIEQMERNISWVPFFTSPLSHAKFGMRNLTVTCKHFILGIFLNTEYIYRFQKPFYANWK
jgi:hypothetical protein